MKKAYPNYTVSELCRTLKVSLSCFNYKNINRSADIQLSHQIRVISSESNHTYGKRRIREELVDKGVTDVTFIRSHQGWSYLACVIDLATKEVVGHALSRSP